MRLESFSLNFIYNFIIKNLNSNCCTRANIIKFKNIAKQLPLPQIIINMLLAKLVKNHEQIKLYLVCTRLAFPSLKMQRRLSICTISSHNITNIPYIYYNRIKPRLQYTYNSRKRLSNLSSFNFVRREHYRLDVYVHYAPLYIYKLDIYSNKPVEKISVISAHKNELQKHMNKTLY